MSFLGDVEKIKSKIIEVKTLKKGGNYTNIYSENGINKMEIMYSNEQFFSHPQNLKGKMSRIIGIKNLSGNLNIKEFKTYMQCFFQEHRFCKFNINELVESENGLYKILEIKENIKETLMDSLEEIEFKGMNGKSLKINRNDNVMEKNLTREFEEERLR